MSVQLGGWLALLGYVGSAASIYWLSTVIQEPTQRARAIRPWASLCVLICSGAALVMVFQGFHLWNQGWDVSINQMDPSALGKTASRARGRGGIILLIMQFFPQFLVFGYGGWLWMIKEPIKGSLIVLGLLKHPDE